MSVKRSPQQTKGNLEGVFKAPLQYGSDTSDPQEYDPGSSESNSKVNKATKKASLAKRKRGETDDISKTEVMDMFKKLRGDLDSKFSKILESNNDLKTAMEFMSSKYDNLLLKLQSIEEENKCLTKHIDVLNTQLDVLQRNARCTSIELRNIPQEKTETKGDLRKVIKDTAEALKIPLESTELKDVYRINTKSSIKPIIADFTTVITRDNFINNFKKYNKANHANKLCTNSIKVGGQNMPVYISENLTLKDRRLYYLTRTFATANNFRFCWVSYGKIFLRKSEGASHIRITCEKDLEKLRKD